MRGLSPVAASGVHCSSRCAGLSLSQPLLLRSTGSRRAGSVVVVHGPSRSTACGIFPDQGSNPCPLHWQADSQPLRHQGSPTTLTYTVLLTIVTMLYITSSVLIYFITRSLSFLAFFSHFTHFLLHASGSHQSVLCIYEFGVLLDSTCEWDHMVFCLSLTYFA